MALLRRISIVIAVAVVVMVLLEWVLTRDDVIAGRFTLEATEAAAPGAEPVTWVMAVNEIGNITLDGEPAAVSDAMVRIQQCTTAVALRASNADGKVLWNATVNAAGEVRLDNRDEPTSLADLSGIITAAAIPSDLVPTRQVTIVDVLAESIPTPTLTRVSYPTFSYRDAFPDATDEAEVVIDSYQQAPMLDDLDSMPAAWREHYPDTLPPVAERLPRNPAVVRGPDGIGDYGGTWHRCTSIISDLRRKIGYESFIRFDPSGKIQPCLAYKWEVSDNNRVYTFYLRKGQRWSDGHPFTTEDILWVCNTWIDTTKPNWMQQTDGSSRLYVDDILDWPAWVDAVLEQAGSDPPSAGRQLAELGGEPLMRLLRSIQGNSNPDRVTRHMIVNKVGVVLGEPEFFDAAAFAGLDLTSEIDALAGEGFSRLTKQQIWRLNLLLERRDTYRQAATAIEEVQPNALRRLNLALFRAAFGPAVDVAHLRYVTVEAVPDKHGDTSHIIRFTFPKPNSIFLEKTGTFMFYLTIFDYPKHYTAPLHPKGSTVLNTIDIYRWEDLFDRIRSEAAGTHPTPGGQLWQLLDDPTRRQIGEGPPADEAGEQRIVDAINAALASPQFFDIRAWAKIDLTSEQAELIADGYDQIRLNRPKRVRYDELRRRSDLLARAQRPEGSDLSEAERFELNLMLFRAAYSGDLDDPLMAFTREDALNTIARNHPRKYTTWGNMVRYLVNYHPVENRHMPTLRAWRVVSEPVEQRNIAIRNPYYYRVDPAGNQLPYIDAVETFQEKRPANILLKLASGNVDFQVREIAFEHYTYLKAHEDQGDYELRLWANDYCGEVTFSPLQARKDPEYAWLQSDPRFRHAMSLALNRQEIIDVVYSGIGEPAQFSTPAGSPYYCPEQATAFIDYDPDRANALLDAMGLDKRSPSGIRLMRDGRPLIMNVETQEERPLAVVQMACEYWRKIGIDTRMQVRTYNLLSRMEYLGLLDIRVHKEGGNFFGPILAGGYAPTHEAEAVQWRNWASFIRTAGRSGWQPPERIMEIQRMWEEVITAPNVEAKLDAWQVLAKRTSADLPIMAVMTSPGKLVYVRNNFKNVPKLAFAGWIAHDPGNCCPEAFYFEPDD